MAGSVEKSRLQSFCAATPENLADRLVMNLERQKKQRSLKRLRWFESMTE